MPSEQTTYPYVMEEETFITNEQLREIELRLLAQFEENPFGTHIVTDIRTSRHQTAQAPNKTTVTFTNYNISVNETGEIVYVNHENIFEYEFHKPGWISCKSYKEPFSWQADQTAQNASSNNGREHLFAEVVKANMPKTRFAMEKLFDSVYAPPSLGEEYFTAKDLNEFLKLIFGKKQSNLTKLVANNPFLLNQLHIAKALYEPDMPLDYVFNFLEKRSKSKAKAHFAYDSATLYTLQHLDSRSKKRLLNNYKPDRDNQAYRDICRIFRWPWGTPEQDAIIPSCDNWHDLELKMLNQVKLNERKKFEGEKQALATLEARRLAWLETPAGIAWQERQEERERARVAELTRIQLMREEKLRREHEMRVNEYVRLANAFEAFESYTTADNTYTINIAKEEATLKSWGDEMHNCIGSYSHYLEEYKSLLLGIYKDGKIYVNVEIAIKDDGTSLLSQCYMAYNKTWPNRAWFVDMCYDMGITIPSRWNVDMP